MDYSVSSINISDLGRRFLQSNVLLHFILLLLVLRIISAAALLNFPPNVFFADITKMALENFANQTRQSFGLTPLFKNQKLNEAARLKAEDMINNQYFSHTSPTGVTPWFWFLKAGYNYKYAGENLAIGFFDSEEVYNAWLNSASHRANLLNPNYKEVGTAVLDGYGQNNAIVVVQLFGGTQPKSVSEPIKDNPDSPQVSDNTEGEERVLSQSIESEFSNDLYSKFLNFMLYSYDELLGSIIFGTSLLIIGALLSVIFLNPPAFSKKGFIFRSVALLILLTAADLFNKNMITIQTWIEIR